MAVNFSCNAVCGVTNIYIARLFICSKFVNRRLCIMATSSNNADYRQGSGKLVEHFKEIKKIKQRPSKKKLALMEQVGESLVNNEIIFRVISNGAYHTCKSVLLQTEFLSYLFNCGDGVMRHCIDHGGKWAKLEHIFVTHKSCNNLAGTLELSFSIEGSGSIAEKLNLHGYGSLGCLVKASARTFGSGVFKPFAIQPPDRIFKDHTLTAETIRISDQREPSNDETAASAFKLTFKTPKRKVDTRNLVKFCVKPGPWIRQLIDNNEPVEVNGKLITPDMILEKAAPPKCVLVIECPTIHHLASLTELGDKLCKRGNNHNFVDMVVHMTPDQITKHRLYQQFISIFPSTTTQLMLPEDENCIAMRCPWEQQVHLNLIDKDIFPFLYPKPVEISATEQTKPVEISATEQTKPVEISATEQTKPVEISAIEQTKPVEISATGQTKPQTKDEPKEHVIIGKPGLTYVLVRNNVTSSQSDVLTVESAYEYFSRDGQREEVFSVVKKRPSCTDHSLNRQYPIVTMLGTGASCSTKTRNTSGILVETSKDKFSLLDCGYGILGQLTVLYGPQKTRNILRNLNMIFISHGHADHHGGLLSLLCARKAAFDSSVPRLVHMLSPAKLYRWFMHLHSQFEDCMENVRYIKCKAATTVSEASRELAGAVSDTGLSSITTVNVKHAYSASCYGICLQHKDWKLVYSGDTMPCDSLVRAAMNADLLIHEATFSDTYLKDAEMKTHSTTSQAIDIANRAKAKFTILTHFSGRHPRMPEYCQELMDATNIGICSDNMVLRPKDLPNTTLSSLCDALCAMYPKHVSSKTEQSRAILKRKLEGMDPDDIVASLNTKSEQGRKRKRSGGDDSDVVQGTKLNEEHQSIQETASGSIDL